MATPQPSSSGAPAAQEFTVRVPRNINKKYSILKFSASDKIDFTKCGPTKIERENNYKEFKQAHDIDLMPKFGAGSEFGREQKEEARRKKYGIRTRRYVHEDQPWIMRMGSGKTGKKFKGTKEGGIAENASYFVFNQCPDGAFEAFPVENWYNFTPQIKYKTLSSEEAEAQFERRDKNLNLFSIMLKKRITGGAAIDDPDEEETKGKKGQGKKNSKKKDFLLTELDEWAIMTDDEDDDNSDLEMDDDDAEKKKKSDKKDKGKGKKAKKVSKQNSDDEAVEESDDADEGREVDYMTDSESNDEDMYKREGGENEDEKYKETGVEDEDGLRKDLNTDDEEDEENEKKEEETGEKGKEPAKEKKKENNSDSESSSGSDSESDPEKETGPFSAFFLQKKEKKEAEKKPPSRRNSKESEGSGATGSRSATPNSVTPTEAQDAQGKKRGSKGDGDQPASKKPKPETTATPIVAIGPGGTEGITEDGVRRYLVRKPMTTKELLQKFKSKNTGLSKDQMVNAIAQILKRINPEKNKVQNKLYLSVKKKD